MSDDVFGPTVAALDCVAAVVLLLSVMLLLLHVRM